MLVSYLFMMAGGVFIATIAQILLKKSAEKNIDVKSFKEQYINKLVIVGYLLLFISMLIPLYTYQFVPLKYGAVIESLGYAFIMILSAVFLKEKITKKKLLGNVLIIVGVIIFSVKIF